MNRQALEEKLIGTIPADSIGRYDLIPVFSNTHLFSDLIKYFSLSYSGRIDYVASPEALGWIFGAAIARELNVGFVPLRKAGKLPYSDGELLRGKYLDYSKSEKALELKSGSFPLGSRVLIADEWIETGATVRCCMEILKKENCIISGLATVGIDSNENTREWIDSGFVTFIGKDI